MNQLATEFVEKPKLEYPFTIKWAPEPGEPFEVAQGLNWLRVPLPISLDHINLWLLKDGDSWVIVDTGLDHKICRAVWEQVFNRFIAPKDVSKIIVTHFHPDHIGLAAWLQSQCGCPILITEGEFNHYRHIVERDQELYDDQVRIFATEM